MHHVWSGHIDYLETVPKRKSIMNILYFTQTKTLEVFYQLHLRLKRKMKVGRVGFYVTGAEYYKKFLAQNQDFEKEFVVLKEWEIYREADGIEPDLKRIRRFETEIGDPTLWGPVVTDRRLYMGRKATFFQDYKPRFSYKEHLAIMDKALQKIDYMFDQVQPNLVCTLYTATFGDCLAHMFAAARGAQSLDLRLARLKNYVMFVDGVNEPPIHIQKIYKQFSGGVPDVLSNKAEAYLKTVIEKNAMYEGVVPVTQKQKSGQTSRIPWAKLRSGKIFLSAFNLIKNYRKNNKLKYDSDILVHLFYKKFFKKRNSKRIRSELQKKFVYRNDLQQIPYILYPLHTEPELVLSQFARPFLNQIEVVRNISLSMPIGMSLIVKEHPMMIGRRSSGYYKKLLDIPNVRLAEFDLPSGIAVENANMVIVIRGAIGLEAVIKRKPVVSLGMSLFDLLPPHMFRQCRNLYDLPHVINDMITNYRYDHENLIRYLASVIKGSVPVNLVSDLLGKKGRYKEELEYEGCLYEEHPHFDVLADYLFNRIKMK